MIITNMFKLNPINVNLLPWLLNSLSVLIGLLQQQLQVEWEGSPVTSRMVSSKHK